MRDLKAFATQYGSRVLEVLGPLVAYLKAHGYETGKPRSMSPGSWGFIVLGYANEDPEMTPESLSVVFEFAPTLPDINILEPVVHVIADWGPVESFDLEAPVRREDDKNISGMLLQIKNWGALGFGFDILGRIETLIQPIHSGRLMSVLYWMPSPTVDESAVPLEAPESISPDLVKESNFDMELDFEVPWDFWEEGDKEKVQEPKEQQYIWEEERPLRVWGSWMERFHQALRKYGWPTENIEAIYSYFGDPVENPEEGEERDPNLPPLMRFRVHFDGKWLLKNPNFFAQIRALQKYGLPIAGEKEKSRMGYYRIVAEGGELEGAVWEDPAFFVIRKTSPEKPEEKG